MANRLARRLRPVTLIVASLGVIALVVPGVAAAAPSAKKPSPAISSVDKQLKSLSKQNDQIVEKYDQAQGALAAKQAAATKATKAAAAAQQSVTEARDEVGAAAAAEYEGGSFSGAGALLSSDSGSSYLDKLDTLNQISTYSSQVLRVYSTAQKNAKSAQQKAAAAVTQAKTTLAALAKQKKSVQTQISKYTKLLATLTTAQRRAYLNGQIKIVSQQQVDVAKAALEIPASGASAQARTAVQFAINQVGKWYSWGSAGPSTFDCSGLTMQAWARAGVSLPHSAANQYHYGKHVSFADLQPGDLMFFYHPIGHVAIYIGNGLMVSAPETGEQVMIIPATSFSSDFAGATRLGK